MYHINKAGIDHLGFLNLPKYISPKKIIYAQK